MDVNPLMLIYFKGIGDIEDVSSRIIGDERARKRKREIWGMREKEEERGT